MAKSSYIECREFLGRLVTVLQLDIWPVAMQGNNVNKVFDRPFIHPYEEGASVESIVIIRDQQMNMREVLIWRQENVQRYITIHNNDVQVKPL